MTKQADLYFTENIIRPILASSIGGEYEIWKEEKSLRPTYNVAKFVFDDKVQRNNAVFMVLCLEKWDTLNIDDENSFTISYTHNGINRRLCILYGEASDEKIVRVICESVA